MKYYETDFIDTANLEQIASIRRYVMTDGKKKGLEVIDCDNGRLRFLLNVSKACDMMQLYDRGQNLSFISKNGFMKKVNFFGNCLMCKNLK